ncbi:4-(cytidine 5'-diphospho)-2-C-methyl-D-erythritol kinase [Paramaledivibacter caminithermalis]|jgi:4-diphosphocytidyl-2-C-methyl-D-erythritol kinase|uniref:4-diphosphocytidyl-2-C-methyl-D-erythritol kinase n=1 Tax=Paramaledivibacter caminithermalis (strain DSM 15212 / CIP 107654 / DViRD3) TaxID=1121301 RepID=A0A1M6KHA4_PARC5|nr:4-(cytidine 5'-diphospho)-2-C-methyl-D-erythritol kinase [Paramaledivibacter caminithermalis]SHJ58291.1 4-diphosphocytidyl-2-C-methyl-D-erythritol kinase [Paramaledivibacter caminithermalis DSM 15212]
MYEIKLKAPAKINLSLDVLNKRDDGYHNVEMVMQQITIYDEIFLKKIERGIVLTTNCSFLPTDVSNIAYKAADYMLNKYGINGGVYIDIKKNIPVAAGLAGGSSDAAGVIKGINSLFDLNLSIEEMMELGTPIGADVPFCILGDGAFAEGIGEKLTRIRGLRRGWIVLSKPNICISTAEAYANLDLRDIKDIPNTKALLNALERDNLYDIANNLCNVFERGIFRRYPIVKSIKEKMLEYGAIGSLMSGSGPSVYGIFKDYSKAKSAYEKLKLIYNQTFLVRSYNGRQ